LAAVVKKKTVDLTDCAIGILVVDAEWVIAESWVDALSVY